jgi:predicted phosphodiesterase
VFAALREFVGRAGRHLVIVLGNHDVELALPGPREWLTSWLAHGSLEARGRIRWAVDGAGFACEVGGRSVLCLHGNEVDAWNVVDHRALLGVIRAIQRWVPVPTWDANAGTRLVVSVMNDIKRRHPIIDFLKPERRAALPVILAIEPSVVGSIGHALRLSSRKTVGGLKMTAGFLGSDPVAADDPPTGREAIDALLRDFYEPAASSDLTARLIRVRKSLGPDAQGQCAKEGAGGEEYLGVGSWLSAKKGPELLRLALRLWLKGDRTFELHDEDDQFHELDRETGAVDFLVAGHTHLRRAIQRKRSSGVYFNTGTWIRLIRIPPSILDSQAQFESLYPTLCTPEMRVLDQATLPGGERLVQPQPTVASIVLNSNERRVDGALFEAREDGDLVTIEPSRFPR